MDLLFLSQADVERLLDPRELLVALAEGFRALSAGQVSAPARNEVTVPDGFLLGMPAAIPGLPMAVKLVTVFHGNVARGRPGHQALICLFDSATGSPLAVMDGTTITALRTAGASALATQLLARPEARILAIVGAGVQGAAHLRLLALARPFETIRVASLYMPDTDRLAAQDLRAVAVGSIAEAVRGADVVCLCTTSAQPVVELEWLAPGTHLTSVGYRPPGGELAPAIVSAARLFVETRQAFQPPPVGSSELAGADPEAACELGEVLLGRRPGRQSDRELTVYKSMGHAMEDLVAANLVYQRALISGTGQIVRL